MFEILEKLEGSYWLANVDGENKVVQIKRGNIVRELTPEEYEILNKKQRKLASIWSDAAEILEIPNNAFETDKDGIYTSIEGGDIVLYREQPSSTEEAGYNGDKYYCLVCDSETIEMLPQLIGHQSSLALFAILNKNGYKRAKDLEGEWKSFIVNLNKGQFIVSFNKLYTSINKVRQSIQVKPKRRKLSLEDI